MSAITAEPPTGFYAVEIGTTGKGGRTNPDGYYKGVFPRREPLSGVIAVHTTEGLVDLTPPDDGAVSTANFFNFHDVSASYNEIVDTDSYVNYLPADHEAWHIARAGMNRHAWGISMAYHAGEWGTRPTHEAMILRNTAERIAHRIKWFKEERNIDVPVRWLTLTQAEKKVPGLVAHGTMQTDRTDPFGSADGLQAPWAAELLELIEAELDHPFVPFNFGEVDDVPFVGDWNGDGTTTPGVQRHGFDFLLRDANEFGDANHQFSYGPRWATPVVGDWNGDGRDTIGVVQGGIWYLKNHLSGGKADIKFSFGRTDDIPLVGDWEGKGRDGIGVYRPRERKFYLKNEPRRGKADHQFTYGPSGAIPVVGDWEGKRKSRVGVRVGQEWHLRYALRGGKANESLVYGRASDLPLTADWNGDGTRRPAVVRYVGTFPPNALTWYMT